MTTVNHKQHYITTFKCLLEAIILQINYIKITQLKRNKHDFENIYGIFKLLKHTTVNKTHM